MKNLLLFLNLQISVQITRFSGDSFHLFLLKNCLASVLRDPSCDLCSGLPLGPPGGGRTHQIPHYNKKQ